MELLVLDLHGYKWLEALEEFVDFYNHAFDNADNPGAIQLDIVHGHGALREGKPVLKNRLKGFLERQEGLLEFVAGEAADGNPGHTIVTPLKRLPGKTMVLAEAICDYCDRPKTLEKIHGQFRSYGDPEVRQVVNLLVRQGRLAKTRKGKFDLYEGR